MVDDQGKIDRLTDLIQDNSLDIAALDSQASDAQQALVRIAIAKKEASARRQAAVSARKSATEKLATLTGVGGRTAGASLEVLKLLDTYLDEAISEFRNDMRARIQTEATSIFRQSTTEEEYAGLSLNRLELLSVHCGRQRPSREASIGWSGSSRDDVPHRRAFEVCR